MRIKHCETYSLLWLHSLAGTLFIRLQEQIPQPLKDPGVAGVLEDSLHRPSEPDQERADQPPEYERERHVEEQPSQRFEFVVNVNRNAAAGKQRQPDGARDASLPCR